jgi:pimeloyl-ACP methyl ester carboxylesterase
VTVTGTTRTPDGRTVAFEDGGDPDGYPVVGLHGTPGCRYARMADGLYASAGVRYITMDRAGYGLSTRQPGRAVADAAADVAAVADALGLRTFGVTGGSGGGPHALACAALLSDRVERASCLSGLAPFGSHGLDRATWLRGMDPASVEEVVWAEQGETQLAAELPARQQHMENALLSDPGSLLGKDVPAADRRTLLQPEVVAVFKRVVAEQCRNGVGGWIDDSLAFLAPWGFDLAATPVPVLLVWGLHDKSVPPAHGRFLADSLPVVRVVIDEEGGHLPTDPEAETAMNMAWLAHAVTPGQARPGRGQ